MATKQGRIFLSRRSFGGFSPSHSLLKTFQKIRKGERLAFNEELAVEALWHEILHNAIERKVFFPEEDVRRHIKEAINEFVARHTYDEFLTALGGSPSWQQKIIT